MNPEKRTMLPKVAFSGFAARYREPKVEEGLEDIIKVLFEVGGHGKQFERHLALLPRIVYMLIFRRSSMGLKRRRQRGESSGSHNSDAGSKAVYARP